MRIIGGARRGKILQDFADGSIRPTGDKVRQAIFNILASQDWVDLNIEGARVLDLACGTGALGCEALSRGAAEVVFYDNSAASLKIAQSNAASLNLPATIKVEFADIERLPVAKQKFDLIFCDPPYGKGLAATALAQLVRQGYADARTLLVIETGAKETLALPAGCRLLDSRRYGAALVWFIGAG